MCEPSDNPEPVANSGPIWPKFFDDIKEACENYAKPVEELAFNPFVLMSDTYHRENFHSDILKAILSPNDTHDEGTCFLNLFYDLLIEAAEAKGKVEGFESEPVIEDIESIRACNKVFVTREVGNNGYGRTDIAICGNSLKEGDEKDWVIIIENKINYACDQDRQLPRYVDFWTKDNNKADYEGRTLVAIVYIVPSEEKAMPVKNGWQEGDEEMVFPKLITIPAYNENVSFSLFNFLRKCELKATKFNSVALFRQYAALMKEQAGGNMDEKKRSIETVISAAVECKFPLTRLRDMLVEVSDNRSTELRNRLEVKMRKASLIGNQEKKDWTKPKVTKEFAVFTDLRLETNNTELRLAIDVPFHDLDSLGVVTFFVRDTKGAPVMGGIEKLPGAIKEILLGNELSPSSGGWAGTRYDDKWKWRERKTNEFYPLNEDLNKIVERIVQLARELSNCGKYTK